ncbi:MAG: hypothetical protein ACHQXA_02985 [Gemmatimonadales bacterium]
MDPGTGVTIMFSVTALATATVLVLRGPLGKSIGKMLETPDENDLPSALALSDDLRARLTELDELRVRLAEVEERLDFSERLLTQGRDAAAPGSGEGVR